MKKYLFILLFLILLIGNFYGQDQRPLTEEDLDFWDYNLPGYYQIHDGRVAEGLFYMSSIPLQLTGNILLLWYFWDLDLENSQRFFVEKEHKHYLWTIDEFNSSETRWKFTLGISLSLFGTLLSTYGQYDRFVKTSSKKIDEHEAISLLDCITAPWRPEYLFSIEVLPVLALTLASPISDFVNRQVWNEYISRESVPVMGVQVDPVAGLALALVSSMAIVTANATWEEIAYRGIELQSTGLHLSSLSFGSVHLFNAGMPNVSVEDTAIQALFATAFGYYGAWITQKNNYDFRKALALHFWNNIAAFTLGYLTNPEEHFLFKIEVSFDY